MAGTKTEDYRAPTAREGLKATAPQVYGICRCALELLGLEWPGDRRAASDLIVRLRETVAAERERVTVATSDGAPF